MKRIKSLFDNKLQNMRWSTNGVRCVAFGVNSLIQSVEADRQSAQFTAPNQLGNTAIAVFYDYKTRMTATVIPSNIVTADGNLATSTLWPSVGQAIVMQDTIDAGHKLNQTNYKVESVQERRSSTGVAELVISAISWDAIA